MISFTQILGVFLFVYLSVGAGGVRFVGCISTGSHGYAIDLSFCLSFIYLVRVFMPKGPSVVLTAGL